MGVSLDMAITVLPPTWKDQDRAPLSRPYGVTEEVSIWQEVRAEETEGAIPGSWYLR